MAQSLLITLARLRAYKLPATFGPRSFVPWFKSKSPRNVAGERALEGPLGAPTAPPDLTRNDGPTPQL
jgi:hypothetical protein